MNAIRRSTWLVLAALAPAVAACSAAAEPDETEGKGKESALVEEQEEECIEEAALDDGADPDGDLGEGNDATSTCAAETYKALCFDYYDSGTNKGYTCCDDPKGRPGIGGKTAKVCEVTCKKGTNVGTCCKNENANFGSLPDSAIVGKDCKNPK